MLKEIIGGLYINSSIFIGSFLLIRVLCARFSSKVEQVIFSFLLSLLNIFVILLFLSVLPSGITPKNISIISQIFFFFSLFIFFIKYGVPRLSLKRIKILPSQIILKIKNSQNKIVWLVAILFFIEILVSIWAIYCFPVIEADSLAYHLQSPPNWFQSRRLEMFTSNDLRAVVYADNQNFFVLWNFLSFGSDILIEIVPYFSLLFGVLIIFYFLQKIRKNTAFNFTISLLYYYVMAHAVYAKTFTCDLWVPTLALASLSMFYSYVSSGKFIYFLFFSLANGLLLGIKNPGIINVFAIYSSIFICQFFLLKKEFKYRNLAFYSLSIIIFVAIGGFQYLKNFLYFHNPAYPVSINIPFLIKFPGEEIAEYVPQGPNIARMFTTLKTLFENILRGDFGYQFLLFYIPSVVILSIFYFRKLSVPVILIALYTLLFIPLFPLFFFFIGNQIRYFFFIGFTGIVFLAELIRILKNKKLEKAIIFIVSIFILTTPSDGKSLLRLKELIRVSRINFNQRQLGEFFYNFDYRLFRKNIPKFSTVLYLLPENALIYPFYGERYENKLIYANSADPDIILDSMRKEKAKYFIAKSKNSDLSNVFWKWDFKNGKLTMLPKDKVEEAIKMLQDKGFINELESGERITIYKINENLL